MWWVWLSGGQYGGPGIPASWTILYMQEGVEKAWIGEEDWKVVEPGQHKALQKNYKKNQNKWKLQEEKYVSDNPPSSLCKLSLPQRRLYLNKNPSPMLRVLFIEQTPPGFCQRLSFQQTPILFLVLHGVRLVTTAAVFPIQVTTTTRQWQWIAATGGWRRGLGEGMRREMVAWFKIDDIKEVGDS